MRNRTRRIAAWSAGICALVASSTGCGAAVQLGEVVDPALGRLAGRLRERGALDNRYVVLTSDHGHTQVVYDDAHALSTTGDDDPPALVRKAGYRLRPFKLEVSKDDDFNAVFASGDAMAYVYVADRSMCPKEKDVCTWSRPPRYEEDVIPMAEAFHRNNEISAVSGGRSARTIPGGG